jgi:hypothetical protein
MRERRRARCQGQQAQRKEERCPAQSRAQPGIIRLRHPHGQGLVPARDLLGEQAFLRVVRALRSPVAERLPVAGQQRQAHLVLREPAHGLLAGVRQRAGIQFSHRGNLLVHGQCRPQSDVDRARAANRDLVVPQPGQWRRGLGAIGSAGHGIGRALAGGRRTCRQRRAAQMKGAQAAPRQPAAQRVVAAQHLRQAVCQGRGSLQFDEHILESRLELRQGVAGRAPGFNLVELFVQGPDAQHAHRQAGHQQLRDPAGVQPQQPVVRLRPDAAPAEDAPVGQPLAQRRPTLGRAQGQPETARPAVDEGTQCHDSSIGIARCRLEWAGLPIWAWACAPGIQR